MKPHPRLYNTILVALDLNSPLISGTYLKHCLWDCGIEEMSSAGCNHVLVTLLLLPGKSCVLREASFFSWYLKAIPEGIAAICTAVTLVGVLLL